MSEVNEVELVKMDLIIDYLRMSHDLDIEEKGQPDLEVSRYIIRQHLDKVNNLDKQILVGLLELDNSKLLAKLNTVINDYNRRKGLKESIGTQLRLARKRAA